MKRVLLIVMVLLSGITAATAQFPQMQKQRERMDESERATRAREHDERLEKESALPVPKPAVMNVDVQMILSKNEYKTFAEAAKAGDAKKVIDGDPLWMYLKFKSKLGDYVLTTRNEEDREKLRYTLWAEVAPKGDITALQRYTIQFAKEDLAAQELKIALAPALFGRNKSIPVFLMTSASAKTGVWNNELRLTNTIATPRALTENLASTPVTLDFVAGVNRYRKMESDYASVMLRGTTDVAKLPVGGTYFSEPLKASITEKLASENIRPVKIYFSGDDWQEFASFAMGMKRYRRVFATFTYREGENCRYGIAEVVENFDFMQGKYGEPEISIQKDLAAPCEEVD